MMKFIVVLASVVVLAFTLVRSSEASDVIRPDISLNGSWEFSSDNTNLEPAYPTSNVSWQKIQVPGMWDDFGVLRCWYRNSSIIPDQWKGKRVKLHFDAVAYRAEVFVNGRRVGGHMGGFTPFEVDITDVARFGVENEIAVWVEGWTACLKPGIDRTNIRSLADAPENSVVMPFGAYDERCRRGIWQDVSLYAVNPVNISTVCIRSNHKGLIQASVKITNDNGSDAQCSLAARIAERDKVLAKPHQLDSVNLSLKPGETREVSIAGVMPKARQWSPDSPNLYVMNLELTVADKVVDSKPTVFGFRDIAIKNGRYYLNDVRVNLRCRGDSMTIPYNTSHRPDGATVAYMKQFQQLHKASTNIYRTHCVPLAPSFYDYSAELGLMIIAESELNFRFKYDIQNPLFWDNVKRLAAERIIRDRNNPAIVMWSIENEMCISYIMDGIHFPEKLQQLADVYRSLDPTRLIEFEGDAGWPFKTVTDPKDTLNAHLYDDTIAQNQRPEVKRGNLTEFPHCCYWPEWARKTGAFSWWVAMENGIPEGRPFFIGESAAMVYNPLPEFAAWGGEDIYRDLLVDGRGLFDSLGDRTAMQIEGFRYCKVDGITVWWDGESNISTEKAYAKVADAFKPVKISVREVDSRFFSGDKITRTLTIYNDVLKKRPMTLIWSLGSGTKHLSTGKKILKSKPGELERLSIDFVCPSVSSVTNVTLTAKLVSGKEVLDTRSFSYVVYPRKALKVAGSVSVYDPDGSLLKQLKLSGLNYRQVPNINDALTGNQPVVILASGGLIENSDANQASNTLMSAVKSGATVIVMNAKRNPAWISPELSRNEQLRTTVAFPRAPSHPILDGITNEDLRMWRGDNLVSTADYVRLSKANATTIIESGGDGGLKYAPLMEMRIGQGRLLLCQLNIGEKLNIEPIAGVLLTNILNYAFTAPRTCGTLGVVAGSDPAATAALGKTGAVSSEIALNRQLTNCIEMPAVIASGDNAVSKLSDVAPDIQDYVRSGGCVVLNCVTPSSQPVLDKLLPIQVKIAARQIQHEQLEKNTIDPLLAGINHADTMWATGDASGARIVDWVVSTDKNGRSVLLREPNATGGIAATYSCQAISGMIGRQTKIAYPGAALMKIPHGRGFFIIDQVKWSSAYENSDNARRYIAALLYNLGIACR